MKPLTRKSKVMGKAWELLDRGEEVTSVRLAQQFGFTRQTAQLALQKLYTENEDVRRDQTEGQGHMHVYYRVADTAIPIENGVAAKEARNAREKEARKQLKAVTGQDELESVEWAVLWESEDRALLEGDGKVWWAVPLT